VTTTASSDRPLPRRLPQPLPPVRRAAQDAGITGFVRRYLALVPVLSVTLLAKIGVPPFAGRGIGIALLLFFLALVAGLMAGRLTIAPRRVIALTFIFGVFGLIQVVGPDTEVSITSMALLVFLCSLFVFEDDGHGPPPLDGQRIVVNLAIVFAVLGLYQFAAQRVLPLVAIKPLDLLLPDSILVKGFNALAMEGYKSERFRPNGIFFLEPSFYSQFIALAIIVEMFSPLRRLWRMALLFVALVTSLSGTGLIVLIVGSTALLRTPRGRGGLLLLIVVAVAFFLFHDEIGLHRLWERILDFNRPGTSSHQRFISPFQLVAATFDARPWQLAFGLGAGQFSREMRITFDSADTALIKLILEYGLVGAFLVLAFMAHAIQRASRSLPIVLSLMTMFVLNGASVPFFYGVAMTLSLWQRGGPPPAKGGRP